MNRDASDSDNDFSGKTVAGDNYRDDVSSADSLPDALPDAPKDDDVVQVSATPDNTSSSNDITTSGDNMIDLFATPAAPKKVAVTPTPAAVPKPAAVAPIPVKQFVTSDIPVKQHAPPPVATPRVSTRSPPSTYAKSVVDVDDQDATSMHPGMVDEIMGESDESVQGSDVGDVEQEPIYEDVPVSEEEAGDYAATEEEEPQYAPTEEDVMDVVEEVEEEDEPQQYEEEVEEEDDDEQQQYEEEAEEEVEEDDGDDEQQYEEEVGEGDPVDEADEYIEEDVVNEYASEDDAGPPDGPVPPPAPRIELPIQQPAGKSDLARNDLDSLVATYRQSRFFTKHHIDSYDDFINIMVPNNLGGINDQLSNIRVRITDTIDVLMTIAIDVESITYKKKYDLPHVCRTKNTTYDIELITDIEVTLSSIPAKGVEQVSETKRFSDITMGKIPLMLQSRKCALFEADTEFLTRSNECAYDRGCYFIINGGEHLVIPTINAAYNIPIYSKVDDITYTMMVRSVQDYRSPFPKMLSLTYVTTTGQMMVEATGLKKPIPIHILFRALGVTSDMDVVKKILMFENNTAYNSMLYKLLEQPDTHVYSKQTAEAYLVPHISLGKVGKALTSRQKIDMWLSRDILPGSKGVLTDKPIVLGYYISSLIRVVLGISPVTDRESYTVKRVRAVGELMSDVFRDSVNSWRKDVVFSIGSQSFDTVKHAGGKGDKADLLKDIIATIFNKNSIVNIFNSSIITRDYITSFTQEWGGRTDRITGNIKLSADRDRMSVETGQQREVSNASVGVTSGITDVVNRKTHFSHLLQLERIKLHLPASMKDPNPRKVNISQYGFIDPLNSPDGSSGILTSLALGTTLTQFLYTDDLKEYFHRSGVKFITDMDVDDTSKSIGVNHLFWNGEWIGSVTSPNTFVNKIRRLRQIGAIHPHLSVFWNILDSAIHVRTDMGRLIRYLRRNYATLKSLDNKDFFANFTTSHHMGDPNPYNNKRAVDLDLIPKGWDYREKTSIDIDIDQNGPRLVYLDCNEQQNAVTALKPSDSLSDNRTVFIETHPIMMYSYGVAVQPFPNHRASVRTTMIPQQLTSAVGMYATNYKRRYDPLGYILNQPQRPILTSAWSKELDVEDMPCGQHCIVGVASDGGLAIEDGIVLCKESVQAGLFGSTLLKSVSLLEETDTSHGNSSSKFFIAPKRVVDTTMDDEDAEESIIDKYGLPIRNSLVRKNEVLVGMVSSSLTYDSQTRGVESEFMDSSKKGGLLDGYRVDDYVIVESTINETKTRTLKLRMRKFTMAKPGNKATTTAFHANKGVIVELRPRAEMPFIGETGQQVDALISPSATITRLNSSSIFGEILLNRFCIRRGKYMESTGYTDINFYDFLEKGETPETLGEAVMYNGITGDQFPGTIFYGVSYGAVLSHFVDSKMFSADYAPVSALTRQAIGGRSSDGGLKIANMEHATLHAHALSSNMKEIVMEKTDKYRMMVDSETGSTPVYNLFSKHVSQGNEVVDYADVIEVPYSFKLFQQEINAAGMDVRLLTTLNNKYMKRKAELRMTHSSRKNRVLDTIMDLDDEDE